MAGHCKRGRWVSWFALLAAGLLGGTAAIRWGRPWLFPDLTTRAGNAYSRGAWDETAVLARQRLKQVPEDGAAWRLAARAAARQDRDERAIEIYSRFILEAMEAEDFYLLGRAFLRTGQVDAGFKAYETARQGNPDHAETLDALGQLYQQNDRAYATQAVAERLSRQPGWEARGLFMLGTARAELEDPAGAAEALGRAFQLDPEARGAAPGPAQPLRKLLVRSLLKARQPAEARQLLQRILGSGTDREATWLLSRAFLQERARDRATALLSQTASYRAEHPMEFEPAPYVGATRCAGCHSAEGAALGASLHARTFHRAGELERLPLPQGPVLDPGNPKVTHDFHRVGDSLRVETRAIDRVMRAVVEYAFGSLEHFTTFVGRDDQGRPCMLRLSHYQSSRGSGWDLSTGLPARPERDDAYLGSSLFEGDGVRRCLYCHSTNFRAILDQAGPESADHAIGCERCHGPGGHHVVAVDLGLSDLAIANPRVASAEEINKLCGQCHNLHRPDILSAPRTDPVWYRFQALALTWSRCYTESPGKLSCVTCHDPHGDARTSATRTEAACLSCHSSGTANPGGRGNSGATISAAARGPDRPEQGKPSDRPAKTACPVSPAHGCTQCHMPQAWQPSTHTFKTDHFIRVRERDSAKP